VRLPNGQDAGRGIILMNHSFSNYRGGMSLDSCYRTTSDGEGGFVIDQVPAGDFDLCIAPDVNDGSYKHRTPVIVEPGQTVTVEIGRAGLRVTGRLIAPGAKEPIDWSRRLATAFLQKKTNPQPPPAGLDHTAWKRWIADFYDSEAGRAQRRVECSSALTVAPDGTFTADDLLPGTYDVFVMLCDRVVDHGRIGGETGARVIGYARPREIVLSELPLSEQPFDLGPVIVDLTAPETSR
jgi:hypothetical protein